MDREAPEIIMTKIRDLYISKLKELRVANHFRQTIMLVVSIRRSPLKVQMEGELSQAVQKFSQRRIAALRLRMLILVLHSPKAVVSGPISFSHSPRVFNSKTLLGRLLSNKTWY